ncbi:MAG: DUF3459 domain-containing protein [Chthoniobacterales bacterium]|nr:DUF3459 domain-containing protein [Chthoniobacterales bacterium]
MKIDCPHCRQRLEVEEAWAGLEISCPTCGRNLTIPKPPARAAAAAPQKKNTHLAAWKRRKRLRKFLVLSVIAGSIIAGAWWFNSWRGDTPAPEAFRYLIEYCAERARQIFAPAPAPVAKPTPTPAPAPTPEATPEPTPDLEAIPRPTPLDPVAWLIDHPARWPKHLTLTKAAEFPAVSGEKEVGRLTVPAGSKVDVVEITRQDVVVEFRKGRARVAYDATDLHAAATAEMARPEPTPTPALTPATRIVPATPSPTPALTRDPLGAILDRDKDGRITGVTFRVWAPNVQSVDVVGTFNRWRPQADGMSKDEQTGIWSASVQRARPGDEYMFLLDEKTERRDPRARQISAGGKCVVYETNAFDWADTADWKPDGTLDDLVIYQLHPGTFYDPDPDDGRPGTLLDAIGKLDHLKDLGVNCILLMPVGEFAGDHSWGYNPTDLFAVESAYGGPDALKEFVKAAHERGIKVHADIIHNHYDPKSPLWRFEGTEGTDQKGGIYFYADGKRDATPWGPRPNFGRREVREFITDQVRMWFDEYKIDGLRWDSTVNIRRFDNGASENPEGEKLLDEISRMIRNNYPGRVSIAEDSVGDERFDASWEYAFHHEDENRRGVVPQLLKARPDVEDVAERIDSPLGLRRVIYTESHDETGFLNGKQRLIKNADPADPHSLTARRKHALAAVVPLVSPGIPFIFMGQELLEDATFNDSNPLDWKRGELSAGATRLYRDLIRLRRNLDGRSAALKATSVRVTESDNSTGLLAFHRPSSGQPRDDLFVVANFSPDTLKDVPVYFPRDGEWSVLLNTDDPKYGKGFTGVTTKTNRTDTLRKIPVTLAPFSAQIFGLSKSGNIAPAAAQEEQEPQPVEQPAQPVGEPAPAQQEIEPENHKAPATGIMDEQPVADEMLEQVEESTQSDTPPEGDEYLEPSEPAAEDAPSPDSGNF